MIRKGSAKPDWTDRDKKFGNWNGPAGLFLFQLCRTRACCQSCDFVQSSLFLCKPHIQTITTQYTATIILK